MAEVPKGPAWRIAPNGTAEVYVVKVERDGRLAMIHSRVGTKGWAKRAMWVASADLFATRAEARSEYARRRVASGYLPSERPNLCTYLPGEG